MGDFISSPVIPLTEAALGVAFLFAMIYRSNMNYLYPAMMLLLPASADYLSMMAPSVAEFPVYYFSLSAIAIFMMIKMLDFKHEFEAKSFFVLTFVCVILAIITTHVQLGETGLDATLLGLAFVSCWWAMDCLVIWMAINGKFTRSWSGAGKRRV